VVVKSGREVVEFSIFPAFKALKFAGRIVAKSEILVAEVILVKLTPIGLLKLNALSWPSVI
jgi:hypothetical protein